MSYANIHHSSNCMLYILVVGLKRFSNGTIPTNLLHKYKILSTGRPEIEHVWFFFGPVGCEHKRIQRWVNTGRVIFFTVQNDKVSHFIQWPSTSWCLLLGISYSLIRSSYSLYWRSHASQAMFQVVGKCSTKHHWKFLVVNQLTIGRWIWCTLEKRTKRGLPVTEKNKKYGVHVPTPPKNRGVGGTRALAHSITTNQENKLKSQPVFRHVLGPVCSKHVANIAVSFCPESLRRAVVRVTHYLREEQNLSSTDFWKRLGSLEVQT